MIFFVLFLIVKDICFQRLNALPEKKACFYKEVEKSFERLIKRRKSYGKSRFKPLVTNTSQNLPLQYLPILILISRCLFSIQNAWEQQCRLCLQAFPLTI